MSWVDWFYVCLGAVLILLGVLQLVFAHQVQAFFQRRNIGKSSWWQDVRGWSLANVRVNGVLMILVRIMFVVGTLV